MNTQLQQETRQLWCDNLGCPTAEEADNYFVCGGTSISAIRLLSAIRDQLGLPIKFVGTGESIGDLTPFCAAEFARALLLDEEEA